MSFPDLRALSCATTSAIDLPRRSCSSRAMSADQLQIEIITAGTGATPKRGDRVTVHYTGWFTNGEKFDSSVDRRDPFQFILGAGQVIRGWDLGVAQMKLGEKVKLTIPPQLGYGVQGYPGAIPPNSTLIFEVELLAIN